jgi:hypothetical protein
MMLFDINDEQSELDGTLGLYLKITSPCGEILGETPINDAIAPCDGSYGLIEFLDDDTDRADEIENGLICLLRDMCEPVTPTNFNPQVGMTASFEGFVGEIVS